MFTRHAKAYSSSGSVV